MRALRIVLIVMLTGALLLAVWEMVCRSSNPIAYMSRAEAIAFAEQELDVGRSTLADVEQFCLKHELAQDLRAPDIGEYRPALARRSCSLLFPASLQFRFYFDDEAVLEEIDARVFFP